MSALKICIIHVGNMANKGTQALLMSDISVISQIVGDVVFYVSTTDVEGVKQLKLPITKISSPALDIPYEKADILSSRFGFPRGGIKYKAFAAISLVYMFVQAFSSIASATLARMGWRSDHPTGRVSKIQDCDLVISYSDENFKEGASLLPLNPYWIVSWWTMLASRAWEILVAKFFGKPVIMFPNSVGPFRTWMGRFLVRLSLNNCDCVLIRDPISYEIVNSLGIRSNKILTADTALLFESKHGTALGGISRPTVGVSPGIYSYSLPQKEVRNYISAHAKALDVSIEKFGFNVVFLPHGVSGFAYDDLDVSKLILAEMKNKDKAKIIYARTATEFKSLLDQTDMIISSKMHPAVLGASGYVPVLCLAYDHKQVGFFKRLGMIDCTMNIREVSFEALSSKIADVWNSREEIERQLRKHIPLLQKNVETTIRHVLRPFAEEARRNGSRGSSQVMTSD